MKMMEMGTTVCRECDASSPLVVVEGKMASYQTQIAVGV